MYIRVDCHTLPISTAHTVLYEITIFPSDRLVYICRRREYKLQKCGSSSDWSGQS